MSLLKGLKFVKRTPADDAKDDGGSSSKRQRQDQQPKMAAAKTPLLSGVIKQPNPRSDGFDWLTSGEASAAPEAPPKAEEPPASTYGLSTTAGTASSRCHFRFLSFGFMLVVSAPLCGVNTCGVFRVLVGPVSTKQLDSICGVVLL